MVLGHGDDTGGCEVMWGAMSTVKIWGGKFVGHGLNQGSKQREYLFLEMCQNQNQKDKMRHK